MFIGECEAWIHGPVYPKVYGMFRSFKYNPVEDIRFVIFSGRVIELDNEERKVIVKKIGNI